MKERKALLDALQKSIQVSEEESEAEIAMLLSDAKESAEQLWTSYTNDIQETCATYLSKSMMIVEKHNLSEEEKNEIEADIGAMFQPPSEEEEPVKSDILKKRGRPKGSKNIKSTSTKPAPKKKKGKAVQEEQVLDEDLTDEEEQEDVVVTKRPKIQASPGKKSATSRPRGRPPVGMQWSESQHKWVPMKLALRRIMDSPMHGAPEGMQWDATKEDWVPMKKALKRLI